MPVLLLCYGDKEAKDLLRLVIESRYGLTPPAIDSLHVVFKGRVRAKVGPVSTWVPVEAEARFHFPVKIRWDFNVRPLGLSVQRGVEAYDGETYRSARGSGQADVIEDSARIVSIRRRLWAIAAILLTPLSDSTIKLVSVAPNGFEAHNTKLDDAVSIYTRGGNLLDYVQVNSLNPDSGKEQTFIMRLSEEQKPIDGLMLPTKINAFWDNDAYFELEPVRAEVNPTLDDSIFTLTNEP